MPQRGGNGEKQMKKYSKIVKHEGHQFRFNYENSTLESLSNIDFKFIDGELVEVKLEKPQVIDAIGLDENDWEESNQYWVERYVEELNEIMLFEV